jgi:glycosyltransferase involved in cell wall biosynthesis
MSRPLLLLIAYHFPPDAAIGGARPFRFYKYMKRLGYECHVLTAAQQQEPSEDIEYVPDPLRVRPKEGWAWQAERVAWKFLLRSDLRLSWSDSVFRRGQALLSGWKGDSVTILSSAPPAGTHFAALRLARHSGYPWIADFRDPIHHKTGNPAPLQSIVEPLVEQTILQQADLVLANTDAMRDSWSRLYGMRSPGPLDKVHVLWNGFDPEDAVLPEPLPLRERKVLSHVGELYGGRNLRPIFDAFAGLMARGDLSPTGIRIRQVGDAEASELPDEKTTREAVAAGWLELRGVVPPAEARTLALESDGLLLIQPNTGTQVPAKTYEYLRMGRPILAFVVKESPVERILQMAGVPFQCVYPEQTSEEMVRSVKLYLAMLDGSIGKPNAWFEQTFSAPRQAAQLHGLIEKFDHYEI